MESVDTRGMNCPAPIVEARKALKRFPAGTSFNILTDNQVSLNNLLRFLKDNNCGCNVEENDGFWSISVSSSGEQKLSEAADYCSVTKSSNIEKGFIVVAGSDRMGGGDEIISAKMINNYLKTLSDADNLPSEIILYGSGVLLGRRGSPVEKWMRILSEKKVDILFCGTSVAHFNMENEIAAGRISNMLEIVEITGKAGKIFNL